MGLVFADHKHPSGNEHLPPPPPGSGRHSPLPQLLFSPKWNAQLAGLISVQFWQQRQFKRSRSQCEQQGFNLSALIQRALMIGLSFSTKSMSHVTTAECAENLKCRTDETNKRRAFIFHTLQTENLTLWGQLSFNFTNSWQIWTKNSVFLKPNASGFCSAMTEYYTSKRTSATEIVQMEKETDKRT